MSDSMPGPEPQERDSQDQVIQDQVIQDMAGLHVIQEQVSQDRVSHDPAAPAPLGVQRMPTGDPGVDAQLERLADADHLPADGHLEVYEDVHRGLRDALTALDTRPAQPGPQAPPASQGPSPSPSYHHPYNNRS